MDIGPQETTGARSADVRGPLNIHHGDAIAVLRTLPDASVNCCVTSPPYYGLRDYGVDGQIGLEKTPAEYIARLVDVFREVRRVLRDDGTLWINVGDSYNAQPGQRKTTDKPGEKQATSIGSVGAPSRSVEGLKPKDLIGIPWMLAFALREPYTDWRIKTEAMRAWVGGIVDGEGCITILQTKSSHSNSLSFPPIVQVRMTDREPLDRLCEVAGSTIGKPQMPPSHLASRQRQNWQWKVVSDKAARIIAEIYPFLTCKRKQAIVAWNHQQFRAERGNQERRRGDIEKEQFCKALINDLNQRRSVDLPSWMKEPRVQQEPGWYLRQDCIWHKPNPMPESVKDRCTKAHEYVFMLTKSGRYWYDAGAVAEASVENTLKKFTDNGRDKQRGHGRRHAGFNGRYAETLARNGVPDTRNRRSVWTLATLPTPEAHFATYPIELPELCIRAGCPEGGTVLDPFTGAGTTALACLKNGRNFVGSELNQDYIEIAHQRARKYYPLLIGGAA